jgi:NAD(P)H-dependent FMN reductase
MTEPVPDDSAYRGPRRDQIPGAEHEVALRPVQQTPFDSDDPAVHALSARIDAADGFVVITPEYNHGYPASLKLAIDSVYHPWQAKPVAFVSYGGIAGGLRAVEPGDR